MAKTAPQTEKNKMNETTLGAIFNYAVSPKTDHLLNLIHTDIIFTYLVKLTPIYAVLLEKLAIALGFCFKYDSRWLKVLRIFCMARYIRFD
jgi:hypothetical protein